jgi:transposase
MKVLFSSCAGLDVHQKTVVACRIQRMVDGSESVEKRTFSTMTQGLLALSDWLSEHEITHVAMESTGDYWKSVYNILEGLFEVWVVNAHHVKNVPGRKTDVKDAEWLAELMRHGLLRPSLVPKQEQREWRDLTRLRLTLVRERNAMTNRMHKALESANIKLGAVASDLSGVSSRLMLRAMVKDPTQTPDQLANLALGSLRNKRDDLALALEGRVNDHHRFVVGQLLDLLDDLDRRIRVIEDRIEAMSAPFKKAVEILDTIPAVSTIGAHGLISEIGPDMTPFATGGHLASWLGLCPGNNQSGGKRLSGRTRKGNTYARALLVQIAHVASRMPQTQYYALYRRIAARRGKKRALIAVAHALVVTIHRLLSTGANYVEPGPDYLIKRNPERELSALKRRANQSGYQLVPLAPAA